MIHRQTPRRARVSGRWMSNRGQACWRVSAPGGIIGYEYWSNSVLSARATRSLMLGREAATLLSTGFLVPELLRLRTRRLWDRSRPLGSAVVEYQAPSTRSDTNIAQGPVWQMGTRDTLSCQDRHRITGYHGPNFQSSEAKVNLKHKVPQYYTHS